MNSFSRRSIFTGAVFAAVAVALGAFGAHMLRSRIDEHNFATFETSVRYQMYHALGLILVGLAGTIKPMPALIFNLIVAGVLIFCGSLYAIVLGSLSPENHLKWLGAITPLGGLALIFAWVLFAYNILKK
jgi:uncharacterized membrane protein YgdD (TMEM256/DUF423 family)